MKSRVIRYVRFAACVAILVCIDQYTKHLAAARLAGKAPFVLIPGVFEFVYTENRGAAFGILQGQHLFIMVMAAAVMAFIVVTLAKMPHGRRYWPMEGALTLLAGGALGNVIDRLRHGYVVDFLYFKPIDFPVFNGADCYVTVSAFSLALLVLFLYRDDEFQIFGGGGAPQQPTGAAKDAIDPETADSSADGPEADDTNADDPEAGDSGTDDLVAADSSADIPVADDSNADDPEAKRSPCVGEDR